MPRHEGHPGSPYTIPVVMKMNPEGLRVLDRLRGKTARGAYLRRLVKEENKRKAYEAQVAPLEETVARDGRGVRNF